MAQRLYKPRFRAKISGVQNRSPHAFDEKPAAAQLHVDTFEGAYMDSHDGPWAMVRIEKRDGDFFFRTEVKPGRSVQLGCSLR